MLPAVAGIGGIGKTRLAIEFVHRYRNHFPQGVFWLNMENPQTIAAQVAACGGQRGLQLFVDAEHEATQGLRFGSDDEARAPRLSLQQQVAQVQAVWAGPGQRLLVFDNLEDPTLLDQWRPRGGGSRVLITTRRQRWTTASGVQALPLRNLHDAASQELLLKPRADERECSIAELLTTAHEAAAAATLVQALGGHPLALNLAGTYLARSSLSLAAYHAELRGTSVNHQSLSPALVEGLPQGYQVGIVAAFALSYGRLHQSAEDQLARTIWLAAAQLAPEPISAEVLLRAGDCDPSIRDQHDQGAQALRRLRELGLIERNADNYRLHRLMIAYAQSVSPDQATDRRHAASGLAQTIKRLDDEGELDTPSAFREHLTHLFDAGINATDALHADLLHAAGLVWYESEDYRAAHSYFAQALEIKREVLPQPHRDTAVTLYELGRLAQNEGRYAEAHDYYEQALEIKREVLPQPHRSTAATLHQLGNLAQAEGCYAEAHDYYEQALTMQRAVLPQPHRDTAITLTAIRNLRWKALIETGLCAGLIWLWLPVGLDWFGAGAIIIVGMVGYWRWAIATRLVRAIWRMQIGFLLSVILFVPFITYILPNFPHSFTLLAILGGLVGLGWPWLMATARVRAVRNRMRR
ncbi:tetratricopeptide repeat protein [Candidatus Viridilinea mediisalina]|uniref:tetratricopeptide repeat protein n=1 Tax=Candidatus Viridilinea mediisalina TaxID=2024553 RepID=UPI002A4E120C|nr:tetratricopeptide repeat protein [Candidatus Viridilinea mediisalina]